MAVGYALPPCCPCGAPAEIHLCPACYTHVLHATRIRQGLARARAAGHALGRPRAIRAERLPAIRQALAAGLPKARACRVFGVKRTTLYDALARETAASPDALRASPTPIPDPGLRHRLGTSPAPLAASVRPLTAIL